VAALAVFGAAEVAHGAAEGLADVPPEALPIHGGQPVGTCGWPTAVGVVGGNSLCTGTLVHPRVVMYAAHCGGGNKSITFGSTINPASKTVGTELCMTNPGYGGVNDQEHDWAFCRLEEAVTEVPITPVVYGCETEIVWEGQTAAIVGFGIEQDGGDSGEKNWGLTPVRGVFGMSADVGGLGDPGICPGDSGGPAFVRYPDGSWHVFGIASTLTGQCGGVGTHSLAWGAVPWIEEESGIDITPCHDVDGTWNPTHRCTGFFSAEPGVGVGEWSTWCPGTPKNASSKTCGAAFDAVPDNTPPTVTITAPASGEFPDLDSLMTSIEISADDGDGWGVAVVRVKINGKLQALEDADAPYAFAVKFPAGSYELIGVAEDAAGLTGESAPVTLRIGPQPLPDDTSSGDAETGAPTSSGDAESGTSSPTDDPGDPSGPDTTLTTAPGATTTPAEGEDEGCGCRTRTPASAPLWLLALLVCVRRRDRRA
jgi:hypothetical protein